jgi:hypothetical protein
MDQPFQTPAMSKSGRQSFQDAGAHSLKRRSGYSRIKGQGARMVTAQDKAKSQLEAPPTQCPRCKTLMKVRKCIPIPGREFVDVNFAKD